MSHAEVRTVPGKATSQADVFAVPEAVAKASHCDDAKYQAMYRRSIDDPEGFWREQAQRLDWIKFPTRIKDVDFKDNARIRWFEDGVLNVSVNCIDRHLARRGNQTAILFEGDDPAVDKKITYRELHKQVCKLANVLKELGVRKGDRVTIYMPMIPETAYAMLACARIGAIHSVVFGGFSPDSLADRINDCGSKLVITTDGGLRGGRNIPLKQNTDEALKRCGQGIKVLMFRHTGMSVPMTGGRDYEAGPLMDLASPECAPEPMSAEDPLFILYTSGSTGKPKGVLHTTGGYLVFVALTHEYVFDYHDGDVYWCTADVGWVTGHSYIVYGPLANGAISLMFEGVPNYPDASRFWQVVDKHKVNIFYTAPTAIRALMRLGEEPVRKTSRQSIRLLGTVGEPINPEAWLWYYNVVGERRCPIVDTWWQTETGGILITPLPGAAGDRQWRRQAAGRAGRGQPGHARRLARPDAHGVRRPPALRADLLQHLQGPVLQRRWRPARRGRLLLDHRPGRRRAQRQRPSSRHRRGGERAGRPPRGRGGGGGRLPARHQGPGHLLLRDAPGGHRAERGAAQGPGQAGAQGNWPDRVAGPDPVGAEPAQDPLGQDHAPDPAQDRRQRIRPAGRHLDAR
jgi:acetyl-CoA synthetase